MPSVQPLLSTNRAPVTGPKAVLRTLVPHGWATYVVDGGRARLTPVELGRRSSEAVKVMSGLRGGERVVLYPSDNVVDGVRTVIQK